jgi:hypothetical protein
MTFRAVPTALLSRLLAALCLGCTPVVACTAAAYASSSSIFDSSLIDPGRSIGGVTVGSNRTVAISHLLNSVIFCPSLESDCRGRFADGSSFEVTFAVPTDQILVEGVEIRAGHILRQGHEIPSAAGPLSELRTPARIGLGSSVSALRAAYPKILRTEQNGQVVYELASKRSEIRTVFSIQSNHVLAIAIGEPPFS